MSLPIHHTRSNDMPQYLPLTPSTFNNDEILGQEIKRDAWQIPHYGATKPAMKVASSSQQGVSPWLEMPPTPPHTTVSPNDNDHGLYLLWTHQLLRENGFDPKQESHEDDEGDGHSTTSSDSSLTDDDDGSTTLQPRSVFSTEHEDTRLQLFSPFSNSISPSTPPSLMLPASALSSASEDEEESSQSSWLVSFTSCFPMC